MEKLFQLNHLEKFLLKSANADLILPKLLTMSQEHSRPVKMGTTKSVPFLVELSVPFEMI